MYVRTAHEEKCRTKTEVGRNEKKMLVGVKYSYGVLLAATIKDTDALDGTPAQAGILYTRLIFLLHQNRLFDKYANRTIIAGPID